jgi:chromosome segregation protein
MYLSRIELFGFKSFAHRVRIKFDKGLTAIVGPNGCGKTNVVDAIRWVLGEQKSSLLRSAKMENIIFNGTKNLKPLSLTEVSITIENTRNVLPTEYTEVTVTRRLYRNGDSDYLLNQVPCRLKDILDLFTDTGMGSDAYSVIELKMIEEIISNKSEERLKLFEEAAGITRYKQRRKQTFRQLENASRDLARVDDVLAEVEKKVKSLKQQVRKAERLKEIKEELKDLDLKLSSLSMAEHLRKLQPLRQEIEAQERQNQEMSAQIALRDSEQQDTELKQLKLEQQLSDAQKKLNETNTLAHHLEKQLLQHQEQQKNLRLSIDRTNHSIAEKSRRIVEQELLAENLQKQYGPLEQESTNRRKIYENLKKQQDELSDSLDHSRRELLDERRRAAEHQKTLNELNLTKQTLTTRRDHLTASNRQLEEKKRELKDLLESLEPEKKAITEQLSEKKGHIRKTRDEENQLTELKNKIHGRIEDQKDHLLSLRSAHDRLHNQIILVNSILDNFEGMPEGVAFLEKSRNGKPGLGCLSDMISLNDTYRKAVNAALGESLSYYVCNSLEEAKQAIASLTIADKGKVHFMVLDLVNNREHLDYPTIEGAIRAVDVLQYPEELSKVVPLILQHSYIVSDLDTAEKLALQHPGTTFITGHGEKFASPGVVFGGSSKGNEGLRLGKKAERDKLQKELHSAAELIRETEALIGTLRNEFEGVRPDEKRRAVTLLEQEFAALEKKLTRLDIEHYSRKHDLAKIDGETEASNTKLLSINDELGTLMPEISRREEKSSSDNAKLQAMQAKLSENEAQSRQLNSELQTEQGRYRDAHLELEKLGFRINACRQNILSLQDELESLHEEITSAENSVTRLDASILDISSRHENVLIESGKEQQALNELESAYRNLQACNHEARGALRDLRRKLEIGQQLLNEFNNQRNCIEQTVDHLVTSVKERYNCELDDLTPDIPEEFNPEKASERLVYLQQQREQFGAVNELAMEEYESEKERLDFLTVQKEDLHSAELQLRNTIDEINKTALQRFQETYTQVRHNFIRIFHELFDPEDEVDLLIHSDEDPLEAHIEIVAKPRGKKPLSIEQLSGGEKALTALSLLFAIYLVKPSPFCILDEVDAPLDDANVGRFIKLLKKFENNTQFIIVTHNKKTMASCQALYGVTMEEEGVSKLIPVKIEKRSSEEVTA